jgi:hypothetical protein
MQSKVQEHIHQRQAFVNLREQQLQVGYQVTLKSISSEGIAEAKVCWHKPDQSKIQNP